MLLLASDDRHLLGVLTDGDVRRAHSRGWIARATLAGTSPAGARSSPGAGHDPAEEILRLMDTAREFVVNHLPGGRTGWASLSASGCGATWLTATAGPVGGHHGRGLRHTAPAADRATPKPMLPVGDRPLLERTVEQPAPCGHRRREGDHPLPGRTNLQPFRQRPSVRRAMSICPRTGRSARPARSPGCAARPEPLLVLNGDILTGGRLSGHARLPPRARRRGDRRGAQVRAPGALRRDRVDGAPDATLREKPVQQFLVNAGIYLLRAAGHEVHP